MNLFHRIRSGSHRRITGWISLVIPLLILCHSMISAQSDPIIVKYAGRLDAERLPDDKLISTWSDSVIIEVDSIRISARRGYQNESRRMSALFERVFLVDSVQSITSDSLYFYQDRREFHLYHHIFYRNNRDSLSIWGDSLQYFYRDRFGKVFGNLRMSFEDFMIEADSAYLYSNLDSLILFGHIQLDKEELRVMTQQARVYKSRHLVVCEIEPRIIHGKSFLNGRQAHLYYTGKQVDSVWVGPNAKGRMLAIDSVKQDTTITDFSGKQIWIHLNDNRIEEADIYQNAVTHYEYWDKKQLEKGYNSLSGNRLFLTFQDNEIVRIKIMEGVEGLYHRNKYHNLTEPDSSVNKER